MPEGHGVMMGAMVPQQHGTVPLSTLIEYIIQSTYHELQVLSELLPRKTDMERKIEIVQFASKTRQLFVRLLALVKWANSAAKVDKCTMISNFLDQQALFFVDTADMLAKMSRVTLVRARLPSFSIPCAIDVLTTGTYPRLPTCIKERIVPPDPITPQEKYKTLMRLNQIIEHRLVTTDLPTHMKRPKIQNGRVKFRVEHEFEVTLTLMGDGPHIPWRLLDIEILVEDPETGDGKALVHSMQINYIHQLVQARLMDNEKPLDDLYSVLHSFCQSLQLEVLHSQTERLIHQRLGEHVRIDEYTPSSGLVLSYWRDSSRKSDKQPSQIYKLNIYVEKTDLSKPLQISHFPQIQGSESTKVAQAIRSDYLSVEKLLIHTIQVRSLARLRELEREFRVVVPGPCEIRDLPSVLYVPILHPCSMTEMLTVGVNMQNGHFLVSMCSREIGLASEIEESLNGDRRDLRRCLSKLRMWLGLQRCIKSAQTMGVKVTERLPIINLSGHPLEKLGRSHIFILLNKQPNHYLIVEAQETRRKQLQYNYYMLAVESCASPEGDKPASSGITPASTPAHDDTQSSKEELAAVYLKAGHMMQLDTFSCTHGPSAKIFEEEDEINSITRKRKLLLGDHLEPPLKKGSAAARASPYFVPELTHTLALCEDWVPLVVLSKALENMNLSHSGIEVVDDGAGMGLNLLSMPPVSGVSSEAERELKQCALSFMFRIFAKGAQFSFEVIFNNCPLTSKNPRETGPCHRVIFHYEIGETAEKSVQKMTDDWNGLVKLYDAVLQFSSYYNNDTRLQSEIEIRSFNYKELVLAYGPSNCYTCIVTYRSVEQLFQLQFATVGKSASVNCHTVMKMQLQRELNNTGSISRLAEILADTWSPLQSLSKLNALVCIGLNIRPNASMPAFTILPQSTTHIRVSFRSVYCLDIHCRANHMVAVRDGAFSKFEATKVVDGLNPVPGLKAFLTLYVDESATLAGARRRSTVEDDNPPSPLGMELDTFMVQQNPAHGSPAPGSANTQRNKFQNPLTPTSNPCTPASPATSRGSNQNVITPSPSNVMAPSPGNAALHVPSPSSLLPTPSPSSLGIHMPSPATTFISPQGPSSVLSPPTRVLPQRSWAASIPTLLTHEALARLTMPVPAPPGSGSNITMSPLERFLGINFLRRSLQRIVTTDESVRLYVFSVPTTEPYVIFFKTDNFHLKFIMIPQPTQTLILKVVADTGHHWDQEEIAILEKFFELKVAVYPYRAAVIQSFMRMMIFPYRLLKDIIQIMRLELAPEKNMRWNVQFCLTSPYGFSMQLTQFGSPMVLINNKGKFLFMITLTRNVGGSGAENQTPINVPILHDVPSNATGYYTNNQAPSSTSPHVAHAVNEMFKRYQQFNSKPSESSLYPSVREILSNLVIQ